MLYGNPQKFIRHADETSFTIEPQRFHVYTFWRYDNGATARTDGQDLKDDKLVPLGSKILKHKLSILVTPETIEPQQLYIARIALSFNDIFSQPLVGGRFTQGAYQGAATFTALTANKIGPHLYPALSTTDKIEINGADTANQEIGGSGSGFGIQEFLLDDQIKHWMRPKKVTVFDQRPLMGERWQRIPSKVKRGNNGMFYGLWIFNDSTRGATPADTQVTVKLNEYWEEKAI